MNISVQEKLPNDSMVRRNISTHFIFWIIYILYETLISYFAGLELRPFYTLISFLINAAVFYAAWFSFSFVKQKVKMLPLRILSLSVTTLLILFSSVSFKIFVEVVLYDKNFEIYLNRIQFSTLLMRSLYFYLIGIGYGFARLAVKREREVYQYNLEKLNLLQEQETLQKNAIQAELDLIKAQINPHFVFNTLGFLYSKTYKSQPDVAKSVLMLSNIMRHALTGTEDGFSTLASEISYIHDFIKIHNERNEFLYINYSLETHPGQHKILSLVLITLVENIFKHGILKQPSKEASLKIEIKEAKLYFYSFNYKNNNKKVQSSKIGVQYVKQRLNEAYPDNHQFLIFETADTYESKLIFPLKK